MRKSILTILILTIILASSLAYGEENYTEDFSVKNITSIIDSEEVDNLIEEILKESQVSQKIGLKDLALKVARGEKIINSNSIYRTIQELFLQEMKMNLSLLSKILIIAIISSIITNLQSTFEESSISELSNYIMYILISILVINSFTQIMDSINGSVNKMTNLMELLLPILLTLLVITSGPNVKIMFHPMVLGIVNLVGVMIKNIIFPLITFSFILSILSNLSNKIELNKLSDLSRKIIVYIISASFTIFIGLLTIYGLANKIDGLSIRTAKFAVDKFVPIVGGFLSDAVDTVISSSAILKNGIGIVGLISLALVILSPLIKITTILLAYTFIGAIIEPIVSKNISQFFSDISKTLLMVLITMVSMGIMFFITITMIVDTGNNLLMLR